MWLLALAMFTTIFTVALTGRYKDEIIELKDKLRTNDEEWQEKLFEVMHEHSLEVEALEQTINKYRSIK